MRANENGPPLIPFPLRESNGIPPDIKRRDHIFHENIPAE
jgi:hypothetical protein